MRGISTVLDVALFLLLVSAAVVALAVPAADPPTSTADETAAALAATTTNVTHALGSSGTDARRVQTATGTHAALLGRGALANLRLSGTPLAPGGSSFRRAVRNRTATALAWSPERTGVVAVWEPYPDAPLRGRLAVGSEPPADVDVSTATLTAPAPTPAVDRAATASAADGFEGVAETVADGVLSATLRPPGSPAGAADVDGLRERRLRAYASALDVEAGDSGRDGWYADAYATVKRRLTARLASDVRERYDSPRAAAAAVRTGTVRIVVREWSP